jgi:hypothetical protein
LAEGVKKIAIAPFSQRNVFVVAVAVAVAVAVVVVASAAGVLNWYDNLKNIRILYKDKKISMYFFPFFVI